MPDARTIELVQHGIDDAIGPDERAELETRLAADAEARAVRDDLEALSELLGAFPVAEPPSELVGNVMQKIRAEAVSAPVTVADRRAERERKRTLALRFAFGLAALLAIGFVLLPSMRQPIDPGHAAGTMIAQPDSPPSANVIPIRADGLSGVIRVSGSDAVLTLAMEFEGAADRQLRVVFDPDVLVPVIPAGVEPATGDAGAAGSRTFDLEGTSAVVQFSRRSAQPASVAVSIRQGSALFETTINSGQTTNF